MLIGVKSMSLLGINGYLVDVQVDVGNGLPSWDVVGLPDTSVKESKERVRAAIKNSNFNLPSKKIVINLAPAYTKKEGSFFDLPIAVGILFDLGIIKNTFDNYLFIGELSLDGTLNRINGILPMCIEALNLGIENVIIPYENRLEAGVVNSLNIYPAKTLLDVVNHLNNVEQLSSFATDNASLFSNANSYNLDFSEVKGQENVKRALEIAAAGAHNCLLIGSPGSGKTMLSRRLPSILPDLSFDEALEVSKIHSIAGVLPSDKSLITTRPFRSPHHTMSTSALIGGGKVPKPGEISLAHHGLLFLDELPEFNKSALESLRIPLEDRIITISRTSCTLTYPCNFMLIASMNPCPCGYYGSKEKSCSCSQDMIEKYINKISGPLLDRIDIHIEVQQVKYENLNNLSPSESSKDIKKRVDLAREIQRERYKDYNIYSNSELTSNMMDKYCKLDKDSQNIMKSAFEKLGLSARAYGKILKVARTIADLEQCENISSNHIAEAIQYRSLDRKYWR